MKKRLIAGIALALVLMGVVAPNPKMVRARLSVVREVTRLALPCEGVPRDLYLRNRLWLADLRTLKAALVYLWQCNTSWHNHDAELAALAKSRAAASLAGAHYGSKGAVVRWAYKGRLSNRRQPVQQRSSLWRGAQVG